MDDKAVKILLEQAKEKDYSGVVYIEDDKKTFVEYAHGLEDRRKNVPITLDTLFAVASGTKFLTALAIGKLIDHNKLSLDTKAKDIYDLNIETYDPNITIRHLLSHTSGMPDYFDEDKHEDFSQIVFDVPNEKLINPKDFLPMFPKENQEFEPGTKFKYNNSGFVYLAIIIEEVAQTPYDQYINQEILRPLGIKRSGIHHFKKCPKHTAIGYLKNEENALTNDGKVPYQSGGDGGAYFSIEDMKKVWKSFFDYKIITKDLVHQFIYPQIKVDNSKDTFYGLGVWLNKTEDGILPYLLGGDPGISFFTRYNHLTRKYCFAASNTSNGVWDIYKNLW